MRDGANLKSCNAPGVGSVSLTSSFPVTGLDETSTISTGELDQRGPVR